MTQIILPKTSQTGANEWADVEDNDKAIRDVVNGELENDNLSGAAGITRANLAALAKPVRWYTPTIIPTEQSRTNTAFGLLETPDEVEEVVLPSGGLIIVLYRARVKSSGDSDGLVGLFLNDTQVRNQHNEANVQYQTQGTIYDRVTTARQGMEGANESGSSDATTGQVMGGGFVQLFADPGTYDVSFRFRATSGSVTASERRLFVGVLGATE